jgi:HAD superfamily hydrolase (TIGR01509 family)
MMPSHPGMKPDEPVRGSGPEREVCVDAIVFDCDGVLVDSERLLVTVHQHVFKDLGWSASTEEIAERFVGKSGPHFQAAVRAVLGELPDDWRDPYNHLYERALREELKPIDGVAAALQALHLPKAVASNSKRSRVMQSLTTTRLLHHFDGRIVGADDVGQPKPAPDVYLRAAGLLGVRPSRCIAVEDSPTGVAAAKAAGMYVLGFGGGLTEPSVLSAAGAHVFMSMEELPPLVSMLGTGRGATYDVES